MAINALKGLLGGKGRFGRESASRRHRRRLYGGVDLGSQLFSKTIVEPEVYHIFNIAGCNIAISVVC